MFPLSDIEREEAFDNLRDILGWASSTTAKYWGAVLKVFEQVGLLVPFPVRIKMRYWTGKRRKKNLRDPP